MLAIIGWQLERVSHDVWYYMTSYEDHSFNMLHQFLCHTQSDFLCVVAFIWCSEVLFHISSSQKWNMGINRVGRSASWLWRVPAKLNRVFMAGKATLQCVSGCWGCCMCCSNKSKISWGSVISQGIARIILSLLWWRDYTSALVIALMQNLCTDCFKSNLCWLRHVDLLWAHSTPQTFLTVGLDQELFHQVSNCEWRRLSFQVSEFELRCKSYRRSKWRFSIFKWSHTPSELCLQLNLKQCLSLAHSSNPLVKHVFWMSVHKNKPSYTPLKYRIEKSD